jgi:hypothetical protein
VNCRDIRWSDRRGPQGDATTYLSKVVTKEALGIFRMPSCCEEATYGIEYTIHDGANGI